MRKKSYSSKRRLNPWSRGGGRKIRTRRKVIFLRNRTKVYVHNHDKVFCSVFEPFCNLRIQI